jgi:ribosomal peptide maturation radical SAM protein 1
MLAGSGLELTFEVKANLTYEHLVRMRAAGVKSVQPGIESLSDDVLRRMDKGCTAVQNIQSLRWCEEVGIDAAWSVLAGFPGESPSEYDRMAELVPLLVHLPPPVSCTPIRLDHFSRLFEDRERLGFQRVRPAAAYFYVFPLERRELMRLAYYYDYDYADGRKPLDYITNLQMAVYRWWELRAGEPDRRARLDAYFENGTVEIQDTRDIAAAPRHRVEGLGARIYLACDRGQTVRGLANTLGAGEAAIRAELATLQDRKLVLDISNRFLSLAVFRKRPETTAGESVYAESAVRPTAYPEQLSGVV